MSARKRMQLLYVLAVYLSTHIITGFVQSPSFINVVPLVDEPCTFPHVLPVQFNNGSHQSVKYFTKSTTFTRVPVYLEKRDVHRSNQSSIHLQDFSHQKIMSYRDLDDNSALIIECLKVDFGETEFWNGVIKLDGMYYHLEPETHPKSDLKYRLYQMSEQTLSNVNTKDFRFNPLYRKKRMVKPTYQIDILVAVDYLIFQRFFGQSLKPTSTEKTQDAENNMRTYFALLVDSINIIYGNIKSDKLNVQINLVGIIISQTILESSWTMLTPSGQLATDKVFNNFNNWMKANNLPTHDHTMLFTGYNIASVSYENIAGRAIFGSMCKVGKTSLSVIVDKGGFQSVGTACHELGHSLGVNHDDKVTGCLASDQFIMTGTATSVNQNKLNQWLFSHCSVTQIETYIESIIASGTSSEKECLSSTLPSDDVPNIVNKQPGQLYDLDDQCRQIYGINSYYCRDVTISGDPADVCTEMFCFIPKTLKCFSNIYHAARGSSCGNKKWCSNGQCVSSELAPVKTDSCVFGDQPQALLSISGQTTPQSRTCSTWMSTHRLLCYQPSFKSICCFSCSIHKTENKGCEYGDKVKGCTKARCNEIYPNGLVYDTKCCGTCGLQTPFTCPDEIGAKCDIEIKQSGPGRCYDYKFAFKCCKSCQKFRKPEQKDCEYGNIYTDERCKIHTQGGAKNCDIYVSQCCQTCLFNTTHTNTAASIHHSSIHVNFIIVFVYILIMDFVVDNVSQE